MAKALNNKKISAGDILNIVILGALAFLFLYPFWNVYVYAFNNAGDAIKGGLYFWPRKFTLDNFRAAFEIAGLGNAFTISVLTTVLGTATHLIFTATLGYALSKKLLPGRKVLNYYFFFPMLFGGGMIPFYLLMRDLHLLNNFMIYIIPGLYSTWDAIMFRAFFDTIPDSLEESAEIDGASILHIFFKIIIPLSGPIFATLGLFTAVNIWNDWFTGVFYIRDSKLWPLQALLQKMIREMDLLTKMSQGNMGNQAKELVKSITPASVRIAVLVVTVTPIITVYPFAQKYFVKGIMLGSVKG